jgi:hypothetical protein
LRGIFETFAKSGKAGARPAAPTNNNDNFPLTARAGFLQGPARFAVCAFLIEHDLFGKPASTFPDHALNVPERSLIFAFTFRSAAEP